MSAYIELDYRTMTGIESIDRQHQKLANMINALHAALEQGYSVSIMVAIFGEIRAYAVEHYGYEEELFARFHYRDMDRHVMEHKRFVNSITRVEQRLKEGEESVGPELLDFLKQWLHNHILGSDMLYVGFFNKMGVK